jgi:hypothetical protein
VSKIDTDDSVPRQLLRLGHDDDPMLTTDRLVYLQLQKTGGTHVARLLTEHLDAVQATKHSRLGGRGGDRFVLGSVRNPWDWYVSLWAYGCGGNGTLRHRLTAPAGRAPGPATARLLYAFNERRRPAARWQEVYEPTDDGPTRFRAWLHLVLDPDRRFDLHEGYGFSRVWRTGGLYSFRFLRLYTSPYRALLMGRPYRTTADLRAHYEQHRLADGYIRQERLDDDLLEVLREQYPELSDEQMKAITASSTVPTNVSDRRETGHYFDDETIRLVAERERLLVDLFGYSAPTPAGP